METINISTWEKFNFKRWIYHVSASKKKILSCVSKSRVELFPLRNTIVLKHCIFNKTPTQKSTTLSRKNVSRSILLQPSTNPSWWLTMPLRHVTFPLWSPNNCTRGKYNVILSQFVRRSSPAALLCLRDHPAVNLCGLAAGRLHPRKSQKRRLNRIETPREEGWQQRVVDGDDDVVACRVADIHALWHHHRRQQ